MEHTNHLFYEYFTQTISSKDKSYLEEQLQTNAELAAEYEEYLQMMQHLEQRASKNIALDNLQTVHHDYLAKTKTDIPQNTLGAKRINLWKAASLVVGLLGLLAGLYYLLGNWSQSPDMIYAGYYEAAQININQRSNGIQEPIATAVLAYQNQDYSSALDGLDTLGIESTVIQGQILLAQAIALHEIDRTDEALKALNSIASNYPEMSSTANWYLALFHIKNNELNAAKINLKAIQSSSSYYERAMKILSKIP